MHKQQKSIYLNYSYLETFSNERLEERMLSLNPCMLSCKVFQDLLINLLQSVKYEIGLALYVNVIM